MSSAPLGPFLIGERAGSSVWFAEDTRNGKAIAIKLLTRQLPKESAKREALIREVRVAAALYHTFLVPILEILQHEDNLLMVMDRLEAVPVPRKVQAHPSERTEFFQLAYQLASVVKYLHTKNILHGNINGDSVLVTPDGQIKLGGLNTGNLLRRDHSSNAYQQKSSDARCVAYFAPEQIATSTLEERTDLFSVGTVLYELATGKLPFQGATPVDIARAIVEGQPLSPKAANPQIDGGVMSVLGACLFKDPFKRVKDARALVEAIDRLDPAAAQFAHQLEKRVATPATAAAEVRRSILLVAEVPHYDDLAAEDPEQAAKVAAQMQQILGESVYLFDGKVIDPFATRLVAELPSVEAAFEAGRKAEFDLTPEQQEGEPLDVRMLLHAGELEIRDGVATGAAVERALNTLRHLPPNVLFISEELVKEGRGNLRLRDAGAKAGLKLYTIVPPEPAATPETELTPVPVAASSEAPLPEEVPVVPKAGMRNPLLLIGAVAGLVLLVGLAVGVMWMRGRSRGEVAAPTTTASAASQIPTARNPKSVYLPPVVVEGTDPTLTERANAIRLGAIEILRSFPELRIVDGASPDAAVVSTRVRTGAAGPELVTGDGVKAAAPVALLDPASGIRAIVEQVIRTTGAKPRSFAVAEALNSFADAVVAQSLNDGARTDASLRHALVSDPTLLPAQLMAMQFFTDAGKNEDALAAARQVATLDPSNIDAARRVARAGMASGDLLQAFTFYNIVLQREPADAEALNLVARYALSVNDAAKFNATLVRLKAVPAMQVGAHEPDLLAATGRLGVAAEKYYDVAASGRGNADLSLKMGRLYVLRHTLSLADEELKKLSQSDPLYGQPMLKAYIAAENRDAAMARSELTRALTAATPGDGSSTSAAEVYAILNDTGGVLTSLENAAKRKEPTAAYVLANPLFRYLESEPRFQKVR
ncbi:MAG: protein kinase, partial [Acidobacteriota bacterium]